MFPEDSVKKLVCFVQTHENREDTNEKSDNPLLNNVARNRTMGVIIKVFMSDTRLTEKLHVYL